MAGSDFVSIGREYWLGSVALDTCPEAAQRELTAEGLGWKHRKQLFVAMATDQRLTDAVARSGVA